MHYSPGQLRKAVGLSPEAYRHWKTVLPSLSSIKGHSARFLIGDILSLAILKRLTDICSIKIGNLSDISNAIFDLCNGVSFEELKSLLLFIDLKNNSCSTHPSLLNKQHSTEVLIVVPLATIISDLHADIMEMQQEDVQGQLILNMHSSAVNRLANSGGDDVR